MSVLKQVTSERGRYYEDEEGNRYTSVTTVLGVIDKSAGLTKWAAKAERELMLDTAVDVYARFVQSKKFPTSGNDFRYALNLNLPYGYAFDTKRDEAASIGTEVHEAIEAHLKGMVVASLSLPAQMAFDAFVTWWSTMVHEPTFIEQHIISREHLYAGTADLLAAATVDGAPVVVDWKTSKFLGWNHMLQVSAYAFALAEMGHPMAERAYVVMLPKLAGMKLKVHPVDNLPQHFEAFKLALGLYRAQAAGDPWRLRGAQ